MTPLPASTLAPSIAKCLDEVSVAKAALSAAVAEAQSHCEHRIVSEAPWASSGRPAMRICNYCRLIEEGSYWSGGATWSRHDFGKSELGNAEGRIVLTVDRDTFFAMRVS